MSEFKYPTNKGIKRIRYYKVIKNTVVKAFNLSDASINISDKNKYTFKYIIYIDEKAGLRLTNHLRKKYPHLKFVEYIIIDTMILKMYFYDVDVLEDIKKIHSYLSLLMAEERYEKIIINPYTTFKNGRFILEDQFNEIIEKQRVTNA